jgi:hypothetical protein
MVFGNGPELLLHGNREIEVPIRASSEEIGMPSALANDADEGDEASIFRLQARRSRLV